MSKGRIIYSSSEGYAVHLADGRLINAPRRKGQELKKGLPMIGDIVLLDKDEMVTDFLPRKNVLTRPRVANIEQAGIVIAALQPPFSSFLLDKYLTACNHVLIPTFIIVSKWDLLNQKQRLKLEKRLDDYRHLDYDIFTTGLNLTTSDETVRLKVQGKTTILMGQTGVGKSSLINRLDAKFTRMIGAFDASMGRGKHQTKEVTLLPFLNGYIGDSPGFSDFALAVSAAELAREFPGYRDYALKCKFTDCLHNHIKDCAVEKAVKTHKLAAESYANYLKLLMQALDGSSNRQKKTSHKAQARK